MMQQLINPQVSIHSSSLNDEVFLIYSPTSPITLLESSVHSVISSTSQIPNDYSTPVRDDQQTSPWFIQSSKSCRFKQSTLNKKSLLLEGLHSRKSILRSAPRIRKRFFGVSDLPVGNSSIKENKARVHLFPECKEENLNDGGQNSESIKVFSLSVTPDVYNKEVFRCSDVELSLSSSSWSSRSPLSFPPFPNVFEQKSIIGCRLTDAVELSENKVYFWYENQDELVLKDEIGKGGFGSVYSGFYRDQNVVVKKIKMSFKKKEAIQETLKGEWFGMSLRHHNVVRTLLILHQSPSTYYIVMEDGGSRNLVKLVNDPLEEILSPRRCRFAENILSGLVYLHQHGLVHLDVKPSNIVIDEWDICRICDFGSCCKLHLSPTISKQNNSRSASNLESFRSDDSAIESFVFSEQDIKVGISENRSFLTGTYIYRAPELLKGLPINAKADVFSFGITAWQLWSRASPYSGYHDHAAIYGVVSKGLRPDSSPTTEDSDETKKYLKLVIQCWHGNPQNRPTSIKALDSIHELSKYYRNRSLTKE